MVEEHGIHPDLGSKLDDLVVGYTVFNIPALKKYTKHLPGACKRIVIGSMIVIAQIAKSRPEHVGIQACGTRVAIVWVVL
ncbi:MAG: hypothetical protein Q8J60_06795 [Thiobacillus sp.]|nr:hypothetical protein [Thiobacillus sp.]